MRSYMYKQKISSILLCFMLVVLFTGCSGLASRDDNASEGEVTPSSGVAINVPQEITMEFFGVNLLKMNGGMWEEHVFSLYDPNISEYSIQFPVGEYEISNSYLNFENQGNLSTYIKYGDDSRGSSILFDENDDLKKICVESDMGEAFCTSFLNIGDNVKEYLESVQPGLWDKFLNDEMNGVEQGWYIRHSVLTGSEYPRDILQLSNDDIVVSYFIEDEKVDSIMLTVVGDIHIDGASIYMLDNFEFYINGTEISTMSVDDWTSFMYLPEADVYERGIINEELIENPLTGESSMKTEVIEGWKEFYCPIEGTEIFIFGTVMEQSSRFELYNINDVNIRSTEAGVYYEFCDYVEPDIVEFDIGDEFVYQTIYVTGGSQGITGNYIVPGDDIKVFLDSFEEGLYEKLISLPEDNNVYQIVPYRFSCHAIGDNTERIIEIVKVDERNLPPVSIQFKDQIVTKIYLRK